MDSEQLFQAMTLIAIIGFIVYIFIQRKLTAEREWVHHKAVGKMNRERSAWHITRQRQQAIIYNYEEKIRQQQDVIDDLTGLSVPKFLHLN